MRDLERSLEFWHGRLGLPIKLRSGGVAELQTETILLVLREGSGSPGGSVLAWEVADLDAAVGELRSKDITCQYFSPAGDAALEGRRASFEDPDGHRLELVSWPAR